MQPRNNPHDLRGKNRQRFAKIPLFTGACHQIAGDIVLSQCGGTTAASDTK